MNHEEFNFVLYALDDCIEEFLEDKDISEKELKVLVKAYYTDILSTNDLNRSKDICLRLISAGLLFKIKEKEGAIICSINGKGVLLVNKMFDFMQSKYYSFSDSLSINKEFLRKNYLVKGEKFKKRFLEI